MGADVANSVKACVSASVLPQVPNLAGPTHLCKPSMSPPLSVDSSALAIPEGWGTPGPPNPPKGDTAWTVGTLLETIVTSGGFSQGHVPDAQEAETLAAQAEQVAEQLKMQIGKCCEDTEAAGGAIYDIILTIQ